MLLGRRASVGRRILNVLAATLGVFALGMTLGYVGGLAKLWDWPPRPSSFFGTSLGWLLALIVAFEMLLWPRKYLHGWRHRLMTARTWVKIHIWVGLVGLPAVVLHSGFSFGGPLSAWTLALFLGVIVSGIYGLILQQWLPEKIIAEVPNETVASQVDSAIAKHVLQAERIVLELIDLPAEYDELIGGGASVRVVTGGRTSMPGTMAGVVQPNARLRAPVVGPAVALLRDFHDKTLKPYLEVGSAKPSQLHSRSESQRLFGRLRAGLPDAAQVAVNKLEELADLRRQWDSHRRLNFWLHNWLLVHLPLSVAMSVLMTAHAVMALKFW